MLVTKSLFEYIAGTNFRNGYFLGTVFTEWRTKNRPAVS
jgi:hypothetical protein